MGSIELVALYVSRQKEGAFQSYHKKLCSFSLGKAIERFSYLLQSLHTTQYVHTTKRGCWRKVRTVWHATTLLRNNLFCEATFWMFDSLFHSLSFPAVIVLLSLGGWCTYGSLRSFLPTTTSHAYRLKFEYRILFFFSNLLFFGEVWNAHNKIAICFRRYIPFRELFPQRQKKIEYLVATSLWHV